MSGTGSRQVTGKTVAAAFGCGAALAGALTYVAFKGACKKSAAASPKKEAAAKTDAATEAFPDNPNPGLRRIGADDVGRFFNNYQMAQQTLAQAGAITEAVRTRGEDAFVELSVKFKDLKSADDAYMVSKEEMEAAFKSLPVPEQELLTRTADRIRHFATQQRNSISDMRTDIVGGYGGHWVSAVDIAGCYAPGGRYPLPSSVLMTAITARVAGVKTVVVASPNPVPATLAAAYVAGADAMLRVGGAQAIAAMAYGVGKVPKCDVIVGPGNRWVTAAKQLISGVCGIDMLAGPSECLVIADETGDASVIAADLLAQSEHDVDARPILVTTSAALADAVDVEIQKQLETLPTAETARVAVSRGCGVVVDSIEAAIAVSDTIAPEHLEVCCMQGAIVDAIGAFCPTGLCHVMCR